jgi:translation initiation factor 3 subunit F
MTRSLSAPPNEPVALISDLDHVKEATESVQRMLTLCSDYVNKVVTGEIKGDEKIGRFLLDTVSAVPKVDAAQFEKTFNNVLQDLLMVVYLANLTRYQVTLQEKLNDIL